MEAGYLGVVGGGGGEGAVYIHATFIEEFEFSPA